MTLCGEHTGISNWDTESQRYATSSPPVSPTLLLCAPPPPPAPAFPARRIAEQRSARTANTTQPSAELTWLRRDIYIFPWKGRSVDRRKALTSPWQVDSKERFESWGGEGVNTAGVLEVASPSRWTPFRARSALGRTFDDGRLAAAAAAGSPRHCGRWVAYLVHIMAPSKLLCVTLIGQ